MTDLQSLLAELYLMLGIEQFSEMLKAVTLYFFLMLSLIIILFFYTLVSLIFHKLKDKHTTKYQKFYSNVIIAHILDSKNLLPRVPGNHRTYLRDAIINLHFILKGYELNILKGLYQSQGFWKKDVAGLSSSFWHKRLRCLVRLDLWKDPLDYETIKHLFRDEHKVLRQIAMRNLSRTKVYNEAVQLVRDLEVVNIDYSSLHEIIFLLMKSHQELIMGSLNVESRKALWPTIVKAAGDLGIIQAVPRLIEIFHSCDDLNTRENAILSLGQIGDLRGIVVFRTAIQSNNPQERLAALHSLVLIDQAELLPFREKLLVDPQPLVRNWMGHYDRILS